MLDFVLKVVYFLLFFNSSMCPRLWIYLHLKLLYFLGSTKATFKKEPKLFNVKGLPKIIYICIIEANDKKN